MSENRGQSEQFLIDLVRAFYDNVEEHRAENFRLALDAVRGKGVGAWESWCEYESLAPAVGRVLAHYGDIEDVLLTLISEQEQLDREATEDYYEKQQAYRELQGC